MFTYSLAAIRPLREIIGPAEYQYIALKSSQIHLHVSHLEPESQDYRLSWAISKHKPGLMLETTRRTTHVTVLRISNRQSPCFMIITSSF